MKENTDNIKNEIKEKVKNNRKYIHPCNKEFQEDIKKYGFDNGNIFIGWMQQNGILKSNACKEYRDKWAMDKGFKDDTDRKKYRKDKLINKEFKDTEINKLVIIDESSAKIRTHIPVNQKCHRCETKAHRRERDNKGNWTGKFVCKKHYDQDFYNYNKNHESKTRIKVPQNEICYKCSKIAEKGEYDDKGNWTGKYICINCYWNDWYHNHRDQILKTKSQWRRGELDPESTKGKSYIFEQIVCITLGIRNCNIETDNWNSSTDIDKHKKYGYISCKGAIKQYCNDWGFTDTDKGKFDSLILVCMSKDSRHVERVYAVPKEEAIKRTGIKISEGSKSWIDIYRINEKYFDDTYHKMKLENCNVLRKKLLNYQEA